eukprot:g19828.t1
MKLSKKDEGNRLAQILVRISFDLIRKHPFDTAPSLPPASDVNEASLAAASEDLKKTAKACEERSAELLRGIEPEINKPKACSKLGLWENLAARFSKEDVTSWHVWKDGLDCVGTCKVPDAWEDRDKKDNATCALEDFEMSKIIQEVAAGVHRKPVWGDALIQRTWDDSITETKIVPELGYALLEGPYDVDDVEDIRLLVWSPSLEKCQWFQAVTAIFGSRHSVTGWCRNGKCIKNIKQGLYGVNSEDYVDDFSAFPQRGMGKQVAGALLELLEELGLPAMMEKVDWGTELEILGLMFSVANGAPEVFLTEQKKELIKQACQEARRSGSIELDALDKLIGRLTFALTAIADRALSPVLRPLRRMLSKEQTIVDEGVRHSLRAIESIMDLGIRRKVVFEDESELNILLYTDASWERNVGWLAGVLVINGRFYAVREKVTKSMLHEDYCIWAINFLETIAGVFAVKFFGKKLAFKRFDHGIDNVCAQCCLLAQGTSSVKRKWYLTQGASQYWAEAARSQMKPWIVRVPSYYNLADFPTREDLLAVLNELYPSFWEEFTEGFGLGEYFTRSLAGTMPDCVGEIATAFATAHDESDSDGC